MITIKNENLRPFDIDDTIILPYNATAQLQVGREVFVYDPIEDKKIKMVAHEPNIRLLKEEKHRGGYIWVWSRSGFEWARNVIKALDLEAYVDIVTTKPIVYFDDKDVSEWLKDRVWLPPEMKYKR